MSAPDPYYISWWLSWEPLKWIFVILAGLVIFDLTVIAYALLEKFCTF